MSKVRRDESGKIKDSFLTKYRSWKLGRMIRAGKLPKGRVVSPTEAIEAVGTTHRGYFGEVVGFLSARVIRANGEVEDLGVISTKKVTTAFRDYIVDSLQDTETYLLDTFKYHGSGTDNTAESNSDTTLGTEVETRATGSQTEGATANIYKTVGTVTYTATRAIVEHGIFNASSSGTLMDRSVFSTINVDNNDSIEFTYEITFNAET